MKTDLYNEAGAAGNGENTPGDGTTGQRARLEQCVPVDTVSMPDQEEQMAAPEPGDTVRYEVEGKVSRVEGGHVYVDPTAINGQPVEGPEPEADPMAALQGDAEGLGFL